MKKHLFLTLILCLLTALLPLSAAATESSEPPVRQPGQCGEHIYWSYSDGILTIAGPGKMDDFEEGAAPWETYKKEIKQVIFQNGVTYVGAYSFCDYDALEQVDFGSTMYELGKGSFRSCDALTTISLPSSFKIFGEDSLRSCRKLTQIHCAGGFPSFRLNSLWDTYATIYYPASRPWGVQYIQQLEEAFHGRIEFIASDGTDHYQPTEETTPSTEVTEETTPSEAVTEATEATEETVESTVPSEAAETPTQPSAEPSVPPTEEQTLPPETLPPVTVPEEQETPDRKSWIPLLIIGTVAAFLLLGSGITMLAGGKKKGKYSR